MKNRFQQKRRGLTLTSPLKHLKKRVGTNKERRYEKKVKNTPLLQKRKGETKHFLKQQNLYETHMKPP